MHRPDGSPRTGEFTGTRGALIALIEKRIDDWFKNQRTIQKRRVFEQSERRRKATLSAGRTKRATRKGSARRSLFVELKAMGILLVKCPVTGKEFSTGVQVEAASAID